MHEPRSAGAMDEEFPYTLRTVCYIEVSNDGTVSWGSGAEAYPRAKAGESRLYAVWPGEWSSHLFEIDDLDQLQTELLDRKKWKIRVELANEIFQYLEIFHNRQRRHSKLGDLTPVEYERLHDVQQPA